MKKTDQGPWRELVSQSASLALKQAMEAALAAANPYDATSEILKNIYDVERDVTMPTQIIAVGKAAYPMMKAALNVFGPQSNGLLITPWAYAQIASGIIHYVANHPTPTAASEIAANACLERAASMTANQDLLILMSGGASSLLCAPCSNVTYQDKSALIQQLMKYGANIHEINCVRRHLSRIKGGRLCNIVNGAQITTLAVSDVIGDYPHDIGSGPSCIDPTTLLDARNVLSRYKITASPNIRKALTASENETIKSFHETTSNKNRYELVLSPSSALEASSNILSQHGYKVVNLGIDFDCDAQALAKDFTLLAKRHMQTTEKIAYISGGEVTTRLDNISKESVGDGGPNQEFSIAFAHHIEGAMNISALSIDTDGIDGSRRDGAPVAGAVVDGATASKARKLNIDIEDHLARHDSGNILDSLNLLIRTGPTGTNVNDLRIILIEP